MTDDAELDASAVEVEVDRGCVQLRGRAESRYARRRAESIAEGVIGVTNVGNALEVGSLTTQRRKTNPD